MKEQLLDAAESLVRRRGLDSVSFQEIADAVGIRKPSVFHHVRSKDDLARSLIGRCGSKYGVQYAAIIAEAIPAPEKLRRIARTFEDGLKEGRACLLASISAARETLSAEAAEELRQAAAGAVSRFAEVFDQGRREGSLAFAGSSTEAASAFLAMLQGLQSLCRATGRPRQFRRATVSYVETLSVPSHRPDA